MKSRFLITLSLILIFNSAYAQQKKGKWKGNFSLGGFYYYGNVDKFDIRSQGSVLHKDSLFEFSSSYKTNYGRTEGIEKNREIKGTLKCDWKPYSMLSPFLAISAYNNIYKGYDLRLSGLLGAKYSFLTKPNYAYSVSVAAIYSIENYTPPADTTKPDLPNKEKFRLSIRPKIKHKLGKNVYFQHITFYRPNIFEFSDYIIESKTTIKNKLTKILFLDLSFEYEYVNKPPSAEIKKSDYVFIVSLQVKF